MFKFKGFIPLYVWLVMCLFLTQVTYAQEPTYKYNAFTVKQNSETQAITTTYAITDNNWTDLPTTTKVTQNQKTTTVTYYVCDTQMTQTSYLASGRIWGEQVVVATSFVDGYLAICINNNGSAKLVARWDVTSGLTTNGAANVFVEDVTGDCLNDIVLLDQYNNLIIIFESAREYGLFTKKTIQIAENSNSIGIGDVNGDRFNDMLISYNTYTGYMLQTQTGFGSFQRVTWPDTKTHFLDTIGVGNVAAQKNIFAADSYQNSLWRWNSPTWSFQQQEGLENRSGDMDIFDVNHDGTDEVAISGMGTPNVKLFGYNPITTTTFIGGETGNMHSVALKENTLMATDQQNYELHVWTLPAGTHNIFSANPAPGELTIIDDIAAYGLAGWTSPPHAPITFQRLEIKGIAPELCVLGKWPEKLYLPLVLRSFN